MRRRTSDGFPMGLTDSPMRIDHPTIYEVTQHALSAASFISRLPSCSVCACVLVYIPVASKQ